MSGFQTSLVIYVFDNISVSFKKFYLTMNTVDIKKTKLFYNEVKGTSIEESSFQRTKEKAEQRILSFLQRAGDVFFQELPLSFTLLGLT